MNGFLDWRFSRYDWLNEALLLPTHVRRIFQWRLNRIVPTPWERQWLDGVAELNRRVNDGGDNDDSDDDANVLRGFLAWRHTNLMAALPIVLYGAIWDTGLLGQNMGGDRSAAFNGVGNVVLRLPYLASSVLVGAIVLCLLQWPQWRLTQQILRVGWCVWFVLPFVPAVFPLETLLSRDASLAFHQDVSTRAQFATLKVFLGLSYVATVLPLVISLPYGAVRAAVRTRGLLPQSGLAGRILVISAPFYSLLVFTSLVLSIQLIGSVALIAGTTILTLNPWIYVIFGDLYVSPSSDGSDEKERTLDKVQCSAGMSSFAGYVLVLVWALKSGIVDEDTVPVGQLMNFLFRGFGNALVTSIVFCDTLVEMSISQWKSDRDLRMSGGAFEADAIFSRFMAVMRDGSGPTWVTGKGTENP